jgi:hypothetical protein
VKAVSRRLKNRGETAFSLKCAFGASILDGAKIERRRQSPASTGGGFQRFRQRNRGKYDSKYRFRKIDH